MRFVGKQRIHASQTVFIELVGSEFGELPLSPVIVIVILVVINDRLGLGEGFSDADFITVLVLHVPEEALLRRVVPAVAPA